jgi:hypothetical protein
MNDVFKLSKDGGKWCALTGSNLQEGCVGFGDAPAEAIMNLLLALRDELETWKTFSSRADTVIDKLTYERDQALSHIRKDWVWICEFCYKTSSDTTLPAGWDFVLQSAVCPDCRKRAALDGGYAVVLCGSYATVPDPRAVR